MAFAAKYQVYFMNAANQDCYVFFDYDGYAGAITSLKPGPAPAILEYIRSSKYQAIVGSALTVQTVYNEAFEEIFTEDDATVRVRLVQASTQVWTGFVTPYQYYRKVGTQTYIVTMTATDNLGLLKNIKFDNAGTPYFYQQTLMTALSNILQKTGLQNSIYDMVHIYEADHSSGNTNSPFVQTYFYPEKYWDEVTGERADCYSVLSDILTGFGACVSSGETLTWYLQRVNGMIKNNVRRAYTFAGSYSTNTTPDNIVNTSGWPLIGHNAELTRLGGLGRVDVYARPGRRSNAIKNGSFDAFTWSGSLPRYWTAVNTPAIDDVGDALKIFSDSSDPTAYIKCDLLFSRLKSLTLSFDFTPYYTGTPDYADLYLMIKFGLKYLALTYDSGVDASWTTSSASRVAVESDVSGLDSGDTLNVSIEIPVVYNTGFFEPTDLEVRIYEMRNDNATVNDYALIDNFRIEATYYESHKDYRVYTRENTRKFNSSEQIDSNIGDSWKYDDSLILAEHEMYSLSNSADFDDNTYAWYIKGDPETVATPVHLGELLAKQRLEGRARTIDMYSAKYYIGEDLPAYWKTLEENRLKDEFTFAKRFMQMDVRYNIARCTLEGNFMEIPINYNDEDRDWASHEFGDDGSITGDTIEIDTTITASLEEGVSETYAAVAGETVRVVVELTDNENSDLPIIKIRHSVDGDTAQTVIWGVNYLEYNSSSAGNLSVVIAGEEDDVLYLDATITFYSLT